MALLKRFARVAESKRAESTEGLIINIGVINALILTFSLPVMVSVDMDKFDRLDFQFMIASNMEFREFAIYVMDQTDTGKYKPQKFDWNVIAGVNKTLDAKKVLLQSPTTRPRDYRVWNVDDEDLANVMFAIEALRAHFPMWQMHTWRAQHPKFKLDGGSDACFFQMGVATTLLVLGILNAMCYYVSFTISPTHAENSKGLFRWNLFGIPLVLSLYAMHLIAVVLFMYGVTSLVYAHAPTLSQQTFVREVGFYAILLPIFITFGLVASSLLTWTSFTAFYTTVDNDVVCPQRLPET